MPDAKRKLFICCSGTRSHAVADLLKRVLKKRPFNLNCFVSDSSIESGEVWYTKVKDELEKAQDVLVCVTPENWRSFWMHFEAGYVVSRAQRIFVYCLPGARQLLDSPIAQYQVSDADKKGTRAMLARITDQEKLAGFGDVWKKRLKPELDRLDAPDLDAVIPGFADWFQRKTFNEPIRECPDQAWFDRYFGARETHTRLTRNLPKVQSACADHQVWLYRKLLSHVDAYRRIFERYLLVERRFQVADDGTVDFSRLDEKATTPPDSNIHAMVERRCRSIRHVLFTLTDPAARPVLLPEALQFAKLPMDQFHDRKKMIENMPVRAEGLDLKACSTSHWEYDRIAFYLHTEANPGGHGEPCTNGATLRDYSEQCRVAEKELAMTQANKEPVSHMPLHYAMRSLRTNIESSQTPPSAAESVRIRKLCDSVKDYLDEQGAAGEKKISGSVARILAKLPANEELPNA